MIDNTLKQSTYRNDGNGNVFGMEFYKSSNTSVKLFLPYSGRISSTSGSNTGLGSEGSYWSTDEGSGASDSRYELNFTNKNEVKVMATSQGWSETIRFIKDTDTNKGDTPENERSDGDDIDGETKE